MKDSNTALLWSGIAAYALVGFIIAATIVATDRANLDAVQDRARALRRMTFGVLVFFTWPAVFLLWWLCKNIDGAYCWFARGIWGEECRCAYDQDSDPY